MANVSGTEGGPLMPEARADLLLEGAESQSEPDLKRVKVEHECAQMVQQQALLAAMASSSAASTGPNPESKLMYQMLEMNILMMKNMMNLQTMPKETKPKKEETQVHPKLLESIKNTGKDLEANLLHKARLIRRREKLEADTTTLADGRCPHGVTELKTDINHAELDLPITGGVENGITYTLELPKGCLRRDGMKSLQRQFWILIKNLEIEAIGDKITELTNKTSTQKFLELINETKFEDKIDILGVEKKRWCSNQEVIRDLTQKEYNARTQNVEKSLQQMERSNAKKEKADRTNLEEATKTEPGALLRSFVKGEVNEALAKIDQDMGEKNEIDKLKASKLEAERKKLKEDEEKKLWASMANRKGKGKGKGKDFVDKGKGKGKNDYDNKWTKNGFTPRDAWGQNGKSKGKGKNQQHGSKGSQKGGKSGNRPKGKGGK